MFRWVCLFFSSSVFSGFLPGVIIGKPGKGGGLAGSVVALIIQIIWLPQMASAQTVWLLIAISFVFGWIVVGPAEKLMLAKWGPRTRHNGETCSFDFNQTNIDEVHGQFVAGLPLLLLANYQYAIWVLLISFIFFRLFDVTKPWPIKKIEKWHNLGTPFAIMIDDTLAGLFGAIIAYVCMLIFF